jgi:hypothetical protein
MDGITINMEDPMYILKTLTEFRAQLKHLQDKVDRLEQQQQHQRPRKRLANKSKPVCVDDVIGWLNVSRVPSRNFNSLIQSAELIDNDLILIKKQGFVKGMYDIICNILSIDVVCPIISFGKPKDTLFIYNETDAWSMLNVETFSTYIHELHSQIIRLFKRYNNNHSELINNTDLHATWYKLISLIYLDEPTVQKYYKQLYYKVYRRVKFKQPSS